MSMLIEVWGDYACFTRPEMKTERVSYDMITPSAARGLVEAIYWHPGLRYTVDRIYLLKPFGLDPVDEASTEEYTQRPIRFTNIRRNEVKSTLLSSAALSAAKGGTPPVRRWSPSTHPLSAPMAMSRVPTPPSASMRPSPTPRPSICCWLTGTAVSASATPPSSAGPKTPLPPTQTPC